MYWWYWVPFICTIRFAFRLHQICHVKFLWFFFLHYCKKLQHIKNSCMLSPCYCTNISKIDILWFSRITARTTLLKIWNSVLLHKATLILFQYGLFPFAGEGRKWASRKEWGKSSSILKQCCFSFPNEQSKNYEKFFGYSGEEIHFHMTFATARP